MKKMRWVIVLLVVVAIIAYGCSEDEPECPVCPPQKECPVKECPAIDCNTCPARIEIRQANFTKYVCSDNNIVDNAADCQKRALPDADLVPVKTNEAGTYIENSSARPACRDGLIAGELFFKTGRLPVRYEVEVRDSATSYANVFSQSGLFSKYLYFVICDRCATSEDFNLAPGKPYLVRIKFTYTNSTQYSNEHLIDLREGSDFMTKEC